MSNCCSHPECQQNFPGGNWGWQRCIFANLELSRRERLVIALMRGHIGPWPIRRAVDELVEYINKKVGESIESFR